METRVRFAPSPTGHVHIGNIRAAIFNWLYAHHHNGKFLLRVEDTDRERSTPEAIAGLLDAMAWLGLDFDEEPLYQSSQADAHLEAAQRLTEAGQAYRDAKGGEDEATVFRIPLNAATLPFVREVGEVTLELHPDVPLEVNQRGVHFALRSKKGKPVPQAGTLVGFANLRCENQDGETTTITELEAIAAGTQSVSVENPKAITFTRHEVFFHDLVKGELAKPLDSMKDQVIVRSNGAPVFHLANVCDDISQGVTHIIRGDDHVENSYRHLFLFAALGGNAPQYGHLPMIVNAAGKPYSKRDGDAYVGDFRTQGFLPAALFNYLSLLGWSPGDDTEKMTREQAIEWFTLDRVKQAAAQMDSNKLLDLNGQYVAELPGPEFLALAKAELQQQSWAQNGLPEDKVAAVAALMQSRTKRIPDVQGWQYFFTDIAHFNEKDVRKAILKPNVKAGFVAVRERLDALGDFSLDAIEEAIHTATDSCDINRGKLNLPLRIALTGVRFGAGLYEIVALLGKSVVIARLDHAIEHLCKDTEHDG